MLTIRFFVHYHPHCPLFLYRREPDLIHRQDPFLFWTIVYIASRKLPMDAMEGVSFTAIVEELKNMVANLSIEPVRSVSTVQALILLCEWSVPSTRKREQRTWHYSGLVCRFVSRADQLLTLPQAIQIGLQMGLHRPHYSHEFSSRPEAQPSPESPAGQERTLTWIYCHIIGYRYC